MCVTRDVTKRVRVRHVDCNLANLNIHERERVETSSLEPSRGTQRYEIETGTLCTLIPST